MPLWVPFAIMAGAQMGASLYDKNKAKKEAASAEEERRRREAIMNLIRVSGGQSPTQFGNPIQPVSGFGASDIAVPVSGAIANTMMANQQQQQQDISNAQIGVAPGASNADIAAAAARIRAQQAQQTKINDAVLQEKTDPINQAVDRMTRLSSAQRNLAEANMYSQKDPSQAQLFQSLETASKAYNATGDETALEAVKAILRKIAAQQGGTNSAPVVTPGLPSRSSGPVIGGFAPTP